MVVWATASQQIAVYLARGQDQESLLNLTGRVPLWTFALNDVREAGSWWQGFGYGASRVTLFSEVDWAGTAHNAWLEILIGTGMIGLVLATVGFVFLGYRLIMQAGFSNDRSSALAASLFAVCLVMSITQPAFALPGLVFSLLSFLYGHSIARRAATIGSRDIQADAHVQLTPAR
jgi:O-antigen ligase